MSKKNKQARMVGTVCLYGAPSCGYGWIAQAADGRTFGDGEPSKSRSANDAYWLGVLAIRKVKPPCKTFGPPDEIEIFDVGGERMATVLAHGSLPYYGDLSWGPAWTYAIGAAEIERVAAEQERERAQAGAA
jgi:hypothetical protein